MSSSVREGSELLESSTENYWPPGLLSSFPTSSSTSSGDEFLFNSGENHSSSGNDSGLLFPPYIEPDSSSLSLEHPALAVVLLTFCLCTVFGNLLVIIAVARERYLHSVTNYFITSLAVADCLVGFVVMPFQAIYTVLDKKWIFGELWCDLWHSLDVLASTASILNLCVISLDRYWAITDPFTYPSRMTNSRAWFLIALVWISSSLISFPAILWWRAVREHPLLELECTFTEDVIYLVVSSIISFYGPLFVMVFTYYRIYRVAVDQTRSLKTGSKLCTDGDTELTLRIHRGGGANSSNSSGNHPSTGAHDTHHHHQHHHHQNRSHAAGPNYSGVGGAGGGGSSGSSSGAGSGGVNHNARRPQLQNSSDTCDSDVGGRIALLNPNDNGSSTTLPRNNSCRVVSKNLKNFSISRKLAKFAKEKKAAKTLGIVIGVFIVCWCPFFVTSLLSGICKSCLDKAQLVVEVALWGGWINSGMNPVIYACWSRDFRRAFGRIVCACCPGRIRRQYRPGGLRPHLARLTQECSSPYQSTSSRDANGLSEYEKTFPSQKIPSVGVGQQAHQQGLLPNKKSPSRSPMIPSRSMTMTATVTTAIITPSSPPVGSYSSVSHDIFNS